MKHIEDGLPYYLILTQDQIIPINYDIIIFKIDRGDELTEYDLELIFFKLYIPYGDIELLQRLLDKQYEIGFHINDIIEHGYINALDLLYNLNIIPDSFAVGTAIKYNQFGILDWLIQKNILPDKFDANDAAANGRLDTLQYLERFDILPDENGANYALQHGKQETLLWLEERGIIPNEYAIL